MGGFFGATGAPSGFAGYDAAGNYDGYSGYDAVGNYTALARGNVTGS